MNSQNSINIGVIGATGYTGIELVRLLHRHPQVKLTYLTSETYVGKGLPEVYPHLHTPELSLQKLDVDIAKEVCDLVFIALPHGHAIAVTEAFLQAGKKVIDLGADFRLKKAEAYTKWYGLPSAKDNLLAEAHYGLPEISKKTDYPHYSLIANPGCYPTAAILGVAPLLAHQLISLEHCILDGKSGVSGAGRGLSLNTHYCEVSENFKAYGVGGTHRHTPEIEQAFSALTGEACAIDFTPHLVPMVRGLFMTGYYKLHQNISLADIHARYEEFYAQAPFVRLLPSHHLPETKQVKGTNFCDIAVRLNERTGTVIVTSVIDNLIKGASGQAIQNMNLMHGWHETLGLEMPAIYP